MRLIEINQTDMENPNKALVVFSNSIAEARYSLSMPTQKLLLFLISKITYEERKQGKFLNTLEFSLSDLKKELFSEIGRSNSKTEKEVLRNAVDELHKNYIKQKIIDNRGKEIYKTWSWAQSTEYNEQTNTFSYKFNQDVAPLLLELKSYFKSNLIEYLKLNSKHSIKLYTIFRANEFQKNKVIFELEDLKKHLQVENKYVRWDAFKNAVMTPSFAELNKNTNYFFEYETERIGRSIGRVIISSYDKTDDRACTRFVRKTIEDYLKSNKIKTTTRDVFNSLSFSFDKTKEILYIRFKDKKSLEEFMVSNKTLKTEKQAYSIIDKGFVSYGLDKILKSLFREQTKYEYSSVKYVKPKETKKPKQEIKKETPQEEETFLDMAELEDIAKEVQGASIQVRLEDINPIKKFGFTTSQAEKVFLAEGNKKIKERVIGLLKKGIPLLDVPKELIKEYQNENIL